jgi:SAM-dependent methyltransferase
MRKDKLQPALADLTFKMADRVTRAYNRYDLPVISTGRSYRYYRKIFFANRSAANVLSELQDKRVLDVGCGLTPYVSNSMFQACHRAGIDFYGIDPKLASGFKLGAFDRAKIRATGVGKMQLDAPGLDKGIGAMADDLPFADGSVDLVLSSYLLFAWISDETALESIFREFHRVLKPGGEVRIFPTPSYNPAKIRSPGLRDIMQCFAVEQKYFSGSWPSTGFPPAYLRRMRKL